MQSEISEFSYGFAVTNDLLKICDGNIRVAPIFPSLIEEGRSGGGYDVKMENPGFPLFLQFKRSECMKSAYTREFVLGLNLHRPYYRFKITETSRSDQHKMLLDLDKGVNEVFYIAPKFHTIQELDSAFSDSAVADRSFCIRPRDIGLLDDEVHHVVFDAKKSFVCSEPREINALNRRELLEKLDQKFRSLIKFTLAENIKSSISTMLGALNEAGIKSDGIAYKVDSAKSGRLLLRLAADMATTYFGSQLFIVKDQELALNPLDQESLSTLAPS